MAAIWRASWGVTWSEGRVDRKYAATALGESARIGYVMELFTFMGTDVFRCSLDTTLNLVCPVEVGARTAALTRSSLSQSGEGGNTSLWFSVV